MVASAEAAQPAMTWTPTFFRAVEHRYVGRQVAYAHVAFKHDPPQLVAFVGSIKLPELALTFVKNILWLASGDRTA